MPKIEVKIPADQLDDRLCPKCGGKFFVSAQQLKTIPILYSPSGSPETMMLHVGFACVGCGSVIPLRPTQEELEKGNRLISIDGENRSRNVG